MSHPGICEEPVATHRRSGERLFDEPIRLKGNPQRRSGARLGLAIGEAFAAQLDAEGDASVPFRYDVHALVFSDDAVGLEARLHQALAAVRVNLVNPRREFFYAAPGEVRTLLAQHAGHLLDFVEEPEAAEWRQSEGERQRTGVAIT